MKYREYRGGSMPTPTQEIIEHLSVYRKRYIKQNRHGQWRTGKGALKNKDVYRHFQGQITLGFSLHYFVNCFFLDLDCHDKERTISEEVRIVRLAALYTKVRERIGEPSLIFRSRENGGLHLYFKLKKKISFLVLKATLEELLDGTENIEILPTIQSCLRFPMNTQHNGHLLNADLKPIDVIGDRVDIWLVEKIKEAHTHNISDVLKYPDSITKYITTPRQALSQARNLGKIRRYEKHLTGIIKQGQTNKGIERIAFNAYANGFTETMCLDSVIRAFRQHNITRHADTTNKSLLSRINAHYRRFQRQGSGIMSKRLEKRPQRPDMLQLPIIEDTYKRIMAKLGKIHHHKAASLHRFVTQLYRWCKYIKDLNDYDRLTLDGIYKGFYYWTKVKGCIPLPKVLLQKWCHRYYDFILLLRVMKILIPKRSYYNPIDKKYGEKGHCRYYEVNF